MKTLRPIGAEFDMTYEPAVTETTQHYSVMRWRVIGAQRVIVWPGIVCWAEIIKPVTSPNSETVTGRLSLF